MRDTFNIAIDGPAGAGKSTIAKQAASRLGFVYVDTGAMYRTMALYFIRKGIAAEDEESVNEACGEISISIDHLGGVQRVTLNGEDVSREIRQEQVGNTASVISAYRCVREKLLELQRELARKADVIMDGRDIGTCVLPDADAKIYLTASSGVRAARRYKELTEQGVACNLDEIEQDIIERDRRDMDREIAPLAKAEDAVLVDTSHMTIPQVIDRIVAIAADNGLKVKV